MKILERYYLATVIVSIAFLLYQCTYTTTIKKNPVFSIKTDSLSRLINGIIQTEEINVEGVETTTNRKSNSELTIRLINPDVFPANSTEVYEIGEDVAILTKQFLLNPNEYNTYKILFVHQVSNDIVTKSDYTGQIYKSDSLKSYILHVTVGDKLDSSTFRATGKTLFSRNDLEIVVVFSYFNIGSDLPIKLKLFKKTDSSTLLLKIVDEGRTNPGNNFCCVKFNVPDFYKVKELSSGNYIVEFMVNTTSVGDKTFRLLQ